MTVRRRAVTVLTATALLLAGCSAKTITFTRGAGRPLSGSSQAATGAGGAARCTYTPDATGSTTEVGTPPASPKAAPATMHITTNLGPIEISLDGLKAPCATGSFAYLAGKHFFDNTKCHRLTVEGIWVLQCGDPSGTGSGGPAYRYQNENTGAPYARGTVAVANAGPATNGSQFFFDYKDNPAIPADYTMLGRVTKGMDIVDRVAAGGLAAEDPTGTGGFPKLEIVLQAVTVTYP
ncbi:peptidylprolyl isomerase [Dactylosporangium sp. NPDC049140]|uniref:peptidylprolyl isomerase n=1 Tax=Dactylosporangium sp. NPDC049140 TaxID=3155647 RepID=UPI00340CF255